MQYRRKSLARNLAKILNLTLTLIWWFWTSHFPILSPSFWINKIMDCIRSSQWYFAALSLNIKHLLYHCWMKMKTWSIDSWIYYTVEICTSKCCDLFKVMQWLGGRTGTRAQGSSILVLGLSTPHPYRTVTWYSSKSKMELLKCGSLWWMIPRWGVL